MTTVVVPQRRGWQETIAIVLLLVGGFFAGVGWLVGVVLLWLSEVWTVRDKLIGTLVIPGGLAAPLILLATQTLESETTSCSNGVCSTSGGTPWWETAFWVAALLVLFLAPIGAAVHLARTSKAA